MPGAASTGRLAAVCLAQEPLGASSVLQATIFQPRPSHLPAPAPGLRNAGQLPCCYSCPKRNLGLEAVGLGRSWASWGPWRLPPRARLQKHCEQVLGLSGDPPETGVCLGDSEVRPRTSLYGGPGGGSSEAAGRALGMLLFCPRAQLPPSLPALICSWQSQPPPRAALLATWLVPRPENGPVPPPCSERCPRRQTNAQGHTPCTHTRHVHQAWAYTPAPAQTSMHTHRLAQTDVHTHPLTPSSAQTGVHRLTATPQGVPVPPGWAQVLLVPCTSLSLTVQGSQASQLTGLL